jgi:hypothetical protein
LPAIDQVSVFLYTAPLIGMVVAICSLSLSHFATAVASTVSPGPDGHASFEVEPSSRYVKVNGSSPGFCVSDSDWAFCLTTIGSSSAVLTPVVAPGGGVTMLAAGSSFQVPEKSGFAGV